jgi:hypothetical protein
MLIMNKHLAYYKGVDIHHKMNVLAAKLVETPKLVILETDQSLKRTLPTPFGAATNSFCIYANVLLFV